MIDKTKYFLCVLSIAICIGATSHGQAQTLSRPLGGDGMVIDARATPYRAVTLFTPSTLTGSYSLSWPNTPPPGPSTALVSDVNGVLSWGAGGTATLPGLPPNNIWVGNSLGVAMPYAPTVPGAIMILNAASTPTWATVIPINTTISVSQLTTGTLQPSVTFNVGTNSTITPTGGTNISNKVVGAGPGNFAGAVAIPQNSVALTVPYPLIQPGAAVLINVIDSSSPGVAAYMQKISPGAGFTVTFSASYPTLTGILAYEIINVTAP